MLWWFVGQEAVSAESTGTQPTDPAATIKPTKERGHADGR